MITGQKKQNLTKQLILTKISDYDIFRMYMGSNWRVNRVTHSPFRKDTNPSFLIGNRTGELRFFDYVNKDVKGDAIEFVQMLYSLNYNDALMKINNDFGLGFVGNCNLGAYEEIRSNYVQPEETIKRYTHIQVVVRKFTREELEYWAGYGISQEELVKEHVYSLKRVYLNGKRLVLDENELRFGYYYNGSWKIYRPYAKERSMKWFPNNVPITTMDGMDNLVPGCTALIVKSKKDYLVMKKFYPYVCAVQNEGIACFSEENIDFLRGNSDRQILSFDSDPVGVKNSIEITDLLGFEYLNVPRTYLSDGIVDWADLIKEYGEEAVIKILKKKKLL